MSTFSDSVKSGKVVEEEAEEEEEEEDEEIDPEDAARIIALKNGLKNGVHTHILTEPLGVLLNKSVSGHSWERRNVLAIISNWLKKLKMQLSWLSHDEQIDVEIESETEGEPSTVHSVDFTCKVNEKVYFAFNVSFAPLSRCVQSLPANFETTVELRTHSCGAYEQNRGMESLLSNVASNLKDEDKVIIISSAPVHHKRHQHLLSHQTLSALKEEAETKLQQSVESMNEKGFKFNGKTIEAEDARIFFGVMYVLGYHVNFTEDISFYG